MGHPVRFRIKGRFALRSILHLYVHSATILALVDLPRRAHTFTSIFSSVILFNNELNTLQIREVTGSDGTYIVLRNSPDDEYDWIPSERAKYNWELSGDHALAVGSDAALEGGSSAGAFLSVEYRPAILYVVVGYRGRNEAVSMSDACEV
ncbi:hypothetical protein K474DRAFT_1234456 [Panus rudis PR-1116 ss-1]|nr:hypothetical protein K474DRAFT_1234456 [Panus rudis PR-1116 ss-1]